MSIKNLDAVKKILGEKGIQILADLFRSSKGTPSSVMAQRYRADHEEWIDLLDQLGTSGLFLAIENGDYRIRVFALPFIDDDHAQRLLELMNQVFERLKTLYRERLTDQIGIQTILEGIEGEESELKEALYYLTDAHGIWSSKTNGFPYGDNAKMGISESVLRQKTFDDVLDQVYEWNLINPNRIATEGTSPLKEINKLGSSLTPELFQLEWYEALDENKKALIIEINMALENGLSALPTMGLRSLIESVMREKVGSQSENLRFNEYLEKFVQAGFATPQHADIIRRVIEAGHASIHREYFPDPEALEICKRVVFHLLEGVYVLKPKIEHLSGKIPPRK